MKGPCSWKYELKRPGMLLSAGMGLAASLRGSVLAGMMVNESTILGKGAGEASCTPTT